MPSIQKVLSKHYLLLLRHVDVGTLRKRRWESLMPWRYVEGAGGRPWSSSRRCRPQPSQLSELLLWDQCSPKIFLKHPSNLWWGFSFFFFLNQKTLRDCFSTSWLRPSAENRVLTLDSHAASVPIVSMWNTCHEEKRQACLSNNWQGLGVTRYSPAKAAWLPWSSCLCRWAGRGGT